MTTKQQPQDASVGEVLMVIVASMLVLAAVYYSPYSLLWVVIWGFIGYRSANHYGLRPVFWSACLAAFGVAGCIALIIRILLLKYYQRRAKEVGATPINFDSMDVI